VGAALPAARGSVDHWVQLLGRNEMPVLASTVAELAALAADEERATPQRVAAVVLHDPLMTFKLLQYIQLNRHARQSTEITTIAHALMMLGLEPFFRHFRNQQTVESRLGAFAPALAGLRAVASRARHAALYARDWAVLRHDIEIDEVMTAALLHDVVEMMLWCAAPAQALRVERALRADRRLRSEHAQRAVLGVSLLEVSGEACRRWRMPAVLQSLINDHRVNRPREANVVHAVAIARHSARGWHDPALPQDYEEAGRLLGIGGEALRSRVIRVALEAAREWRWYGVRPAAAWLPLTAGSLAPEDEVGSYPEIRP
jgi:HD-like signal output (HDOD) protein